MPSHTNPRERSFTLPIIAASIAVPALVFVLFYVKMPKPAVGFNLKILPAINASLNFTTALLLCLGYYFIRRRRRKLHKYSMIAAFCLSSLFLICYVTYHALAVETHFGGTGWIRPVYFFILITHIFLAAVIVPLVLFTMTRGLQSRFDKHRRIARWTLPLWLYVAVTGVITYLLLSPYYA